MTVALGIDVGSTSVKASVARVSDGIEELATATRDTAGLDAGGLVSAALSAARGALIEADADLPRVIGVASMAETGAITTADGVPQGDLIRWDRHGDQRRRDELSVRLDPRALHTATGVPMSRKLPLLTWAEGGIDVGGAHWAFTADLVVAALTGHRATDHTLAGRSGAYRLPAASEVLPESWDDELLALFDIAPDFPPPVLARAEPAGRVTPEALAALGGRVHPAAEVYTAGHDHAVAAWVAGARGAGRSVRSIGTTEAAMSISAGSIDRECAWRDGISVTRTVDGACETALAGSPTAGSLIADWSKRAVAAGADTEALLRRAEAEAGPDAAIALPYPRGRQCPDPDPAAVLVLRGVPDGDLSAELHALLRGIAAHGGWMAEATRALSGAPADPVLVGAPFRRNHRLAGLAAVVAGGPLELVDLATPVATGAAALAAVRAGLAAPAAPPMRIVEPARVEPDVAERFRSALAAASSSPRRPAPPRHRAADHSAPSQTGRP